MNTEKIKLEMQKENFGTKKVNKISSNLPVIKSFIAVCGNEYFEGEKYIPECAETMGVMGFERDKALLMTEDEVKDICSRYRECKAMNVL